MKTVRTRRTLSLCALCFGALLAVAVPASAQTPQPAPRADVSWNGDAESLLFHVTLVAATKEAGGGGTGNLPKAVAKALDDIRDFLPYQGYRVIDSALVRSIAEAEARLTGPDGRPMIAHFLFRSARGGSGGGPAGYLVEHFRLQRAPGVEAVARRSAADAEGRRAPEAPMPTMDASFRIDRGETVVVGSSRLDGGDGALIVLLTAVP